MAYGDVISNLGPTINFKFMEGDKDDVRLSKRGAHNTELDKFKMSYVRNIKLGGVGSEAEGTRWCQRNENVEPGVMETIGEISGDDRVVKFRAGFQVISLEATRRLGSQAILLSVKKSGKTGLLPSSFTYVAKRELKGLLPGSTGTPKLRELIIVKTRPREGKYGGTGGGAGMGKEVDRGDGGGVYVLNERGWD
ncbi:hypothetical protein KSS87_016210 [Heliosperma pusillum]|nr:hypothetical protein KSS87_016210 [Heliosperma pusillum]